MTDPLAEFGQYKPSSDRVERKLDDANARMDALQNRTLRNSIVGQGGSFRGTVVDGGANVIEIGKGSEFYGSKQVMKMRDIGGRLMYQHDEVAGYGLSAPLYGYPMYTIPGVSAASGVASEFARSEAFIYNSVWYVKVLIRNMTGLATSWSVVFKASSPGLPDFTTSAFVYTGGATYMTRFLLLPVEYMNAQTVTGQILATPNNTGALEVWPVVSAGRYKAYWDSNPGLR